jgi:3-oxoadipate enol-lactonase
MIGMWLAAHAPDRITRLALCCTSARLDLAWAQRAATVRSQGMGPIADGTADRWFTRAFQDREPGTVGPIVDRLRQVTPEGYAGCCDAIGAMDQCAAIASVTAPTLVIAGSQDPATPPWHGAVIARAIPGARLRVIRGASHLANVSQPAETTALLLGHLAGEAGPSERRAAALFPDER